MISTFRHPLFAPDTTPSSRHSANDTSPASFILLSGLSGAGHSTVLRTFEDYGFIAIDNMPLEFLPRLSELYEQKDPMGPVVVGVDTRTLDFSADYFSKVFLSLKSMRPHLRFLFLECEESILLTRYKQTRRPHPFFKKDLESALRHEFDIVRPIRFLADEILDTSHKSVEQTALWVRENFCVREPKLIVQLMSFSYRYGVPLQADIVLDARFLQNPFYESDLKHKTGRDKEVQDYLAKDPLFSDFWAACLQTLYLSMIGFKQRGRSYVTIAVGCTGGQHRSVYLVESLAQWIQSGCTECTVHTQHKLSPHHIMCQVEHRELRS